METPTVKKLIEFATGRNFDEETNNPDAIALARKRIAVAAEGR